MKITSRVSEENEQLQRLREILDAATGGSIGEGGDVEPGKTLTELVTQVDITCASFMETLDITERKVAHLSKDVQRLSAHIAEQEVMLQQMHDVLDGGVDYDEDLDHAAIDFMESLVSAGAAEPTFDGEISFDSHVIFSREDIKPFLRQAIESWVLLKRR